MSKPKASAGAAARRPPPQWRKTFLAELARTFNVAASARKAKVDVSNAYKTRRAETRFAREWFEALCEGYDNLEMDLLQRLREGELDGGVAPKPAKARRKFDNATAFRLLAAHRAAVVRQRARREDQDEQAIYDSIHAKLDLMRQRVKALPGLLEPDGPYQLPPPEPGEPPNLPIPMRSEQELLRILLSVNRKERQRTLASLSEEERALIRYDWQVLAREEQVPPAGDWHTWLISAGRGFGKTRAGAEWVRYVARTEPEARIALVGASLAEARSIMVEGESGVLTCCHPERLPKFEPSLRRVQWPSGAQAFLYSAAEPESLRGPQHSHAWCDEIGKWDLASERATRSWDNLVLGLRLGERPRVLATTTPRAVPLVRRLFADAARGSVAVTRGSTYDNGLNLPARYLGDIARFNGTVLGRQEVHGEMVADAEGALWRRELLERCREAFSPEPLVRVVVAVDPPASATGDECGIVVAGVTGSGAGKVLADASVAKASPERWAQAVADAAQVWQADRVVAEKNQGGQMVESVLRAADCAMPVRLVHASRGKAARAEPIAALYEVGKVRHVGMFARLEDQLCGLMAGGGYEGPGRSPDRADALVWALSELMLGRRGEPRVLVV